MSISKEIAIAMIKELNTTNNDLISNIEEIESEINKNDELIETVKKVANITDEDLFEKEYEAFQEEAEIKTPQEKTKNGFPYHKHSEECDYNHYCEDCAFFRLDENKEPCCICCNISIWEDAPCFFKQLKH
jgi:hypothetical protein